MVYDGIVDFGVVEGCIYFFYGLFRVIGKGGNFVEEE